MAGVNILPCPFCGGAARLDRRTGITGVAVKTRWLREQVVCKSRKCGAQSPSLKSPGLAVSRWNARAAAIAKAEQSA